MNNYSFLIFPTYCLLFTFYKNLNNSYVFNLIYFLKFLSANDYWNHKNLCLTKCCHFKFKHWWLRLFLKLYKTYVLEFFKSYFINKLFKSPSSGLCEKWFTSIDHLIFYTFYISLYLFIIWSVRQKIWLVQNILWLRLFCLFSLRRNYFQCKSIVV